MINAACEPVFSSLTARLAYAAQADWQVARVNGVCVSHTQFRRHLADACARLQRRPEACWGLFFDDAYHFLVAFLALLLSGKTPILLPHAQPGLIAGIAELQALVSDREDSLGALPQICMRLPESVAAQDVVLPVLHERDARVVLYTSGSTGEPKRVTKTLVQLQAEIEVLEQSWGSVLGDAVVFSTVSHQHIYGLLFRLLWPLLKGRTFDSTTWQYPEPLLQQMLACGAAVLVSSPAHLKRMPELIDLTQLRGKVRAVFSSGGVLPQDAALAVANVLAVTVAEVYGSTETGGIAQRCQSRESQAVAWQPLPRVKFRINPLTHCLEIDSPFEGSGDWYAMNDVVEQAAGGFVLLGRSDRIVKVEEKRLSLLELELRLQAHTWVEDVAAVVLRNHRSSVGVAMVLSAAGRAALTEMGKQLLDAQLRQYLAEFFEAVVLPKKWRHLDCLPYNAQGKLVQSTVEALFVRQEVIQPVVLDAQLSEDGVLLRLSIPEDLVYFGGHFPGNPIVPGVALLDWVATMGERYLGVPARYRRLEAIKFHEFVRPKDVVQLQLRLDNTANGKLYFSYDSGSGCYASGRFVVS